MACPHIYKERGGHPGQRVCKLLKLQSVIHGCITLTNDVHLTVTYDTPRIVHGRKRWPHSSSKALLHHLLSFVVCLLPFAPAGCTLALLCRNVHIIRFRCNWGSSCHWLATCHPLLCNPLGVQSIGCSVQRPGAHNDRVAKAPTVR